MHSEKQMMLFFCHSSRMLKKRWNLQSFDELNFVHILSSLLEMDFFMLLILRFIFISYFNVSEIGICLIHVGVVV